MEESTIKKQPEPEFPPPLGPQSAKTLALEAAVKQFVQGIPMAIIV